MPLYRQLALLALLLALSSPAYALSQNSSSIMKFASFAIPSGQQFSVQPFPLSGSQAYAVVSGGEVYGIFAQGLPILEDRPLTAPDELESALSAYYLSKGYSRNLSFADVHAGLISVMASHERGEAKCRILLGTDRTACTSFETCQKACYSVTSFCLNIALGSGKEFVNEIWKFENGSRALDAAYLDESTAYSQLLDGITPSEARAYLNALISLNRAATSASKSPLFDGYSYCFEPDYALPVITNMQLTAQKRYAQAEVFFALQDNAMRVRSLTTAALEAKSSAERDAHAAQAAKDAALAGWNQSLPNPLSPLPASMPSDSPVLSSLAAPLISLAELAVIVAIGAFLVMRGRKKKV
ncbi:MAG: hypothetical protein WC263_01555 [Candidatus Micrarchaeia archaeon]